MASRKLLALATLASVSASAGLAETSVNDGRQPVVQGSGHIVRQVRPIGAASAIELAGATNAQVRLGAAPSLVIEADDNLMPLLTTEMRGNTLVVGSRGSYRTNHSPRVYVTLPDVREIRSSGSGDVDLLGVANAGLTLSIRGSGDMKVTGRTGRLDATVEGSGDLDLRQLAAEDARVGVMGSGNASVRVAHALDASAFGSGDVYYLGRPAALSVHAGGTGRILPVGG